MLKGGINMPKVAVLNNKAEKIKDIKLSDEIFGVEPNDQTIYDAVVLVETYNNNSIAISISSFKE